MVLAGSLNQRKDRNTTTCSGKHVTDQLLGVTNIREAEQELIGVVIPAYGKEFDELSERAMARGDATPGNFKFSVTRTVHQVR